MIKVKFIKGIFMIIQNVDMVFKSTPMAMFI